MFKVGLVDLDTSHPKSWLPTWRTIAGTRVSSVCDGGAVYDPGYAKGFAAEEGIKEAYDSPEEMVAAVDGAVIHSCNWDVHLERAQPFIAAGKPVFLDKPVVGNFTDVQRLRSLVEQGADIIGGSALRYAQEVTDFAAENPPESVYTLFATCPNDWFNYGIHGYELVLGVMGPGVESVRMLDGGDDPALIQMNYGDGRRAVLQLRTPKGRFHITASCRNGIHSVAVGTKNVYAPLIHNIAAHFKGESPFPVDTEQMLESCLAALAAIRSRETGERVRLADVDESFPGYDGNAFEAEYRAMKRSA